MQESEIQVLIEKCRALPPAEDNYLVDDFIENLILTVIDFQMHTTAVRRAYKHFQELEPKLRTLDELNAVFDRYPDSKDGNTELALELWGYKFWTRAEMLRRLTEFFESEGVTTQEGLQAWANKSSFEHDFQGRVKGLGPAVYNWLVMRQGIETVKPDVHVRRFVETALNRTVNDREIVESLEEVARRLSIKAYELDWAIWEAGRSN